jgi:hypothetical protein
MMIFGPDPDVEYDYVVLRRFVTLTAEEIVGMRRRCSHITFE